MSHQSSGTGFCRHTSESHVSSLCLCVSEGHNLMNVLSYTNVHCHINILNMPYFSES